MISDNDHAGLGTFLVGMVVLVMAAVGLSLVVDRRFQFSGKTHDLTREIAHDREDLAQLRNSLARQEDAWIASAGAPETSEADLLATDAMLAELVKQRAALAAQAEVLRREVPALEAEFASYRSAYRKRAWRGAQGEKLPVLELRGGRSFRDVTLTRVTEVGIEISHATGTARISAPDQSTGWHERFQWNDEERRQKLLSEQLHRQRMITAAQAQATTPVTVKPMARTRRMAAEEIDPERLEAARSELQLWRMRRNTVRAEHRTAAARAQSRQQMSVPGSLETWSARAQRLSVDLARANAGYVAARRSLSTISPGDSLLRPRDDD